MIVTSSNPALRTRDVIALNDHGAIVGLAGVAAATEIAEGWAASGLASLLQDALADER